MGLTLLRGREYEQAVELLKKVGEEHPGSLYEARALLGLGYAFEFGFQDLARAEKAYRLYLDKFPQAPNRMKVLWEASSCAYWRNRFEQVLSDLDEIQSLEARSLSELDSMGDSSVRLFRRGSCFVHLKKWKEAAQTLGRFVRTYPSHELTPSAILLQAQALEQSEGTEEARRLLNQAQKNKLLGKLSWAARREKDRMSLVEPIPITDDDPSL